MIASHWYRLIIEVEEPALNRAGIERYLRQIVTGDDEKIFEPVELALLPATVQWHVTEFVYGPSMEDQNERLNDVCEEAITHLDNGLSKIYEAAGMSAENETELAKFRSLAAQVEAVIDTCRPGS